MGILLLFCGLTFSPDPILSVQQPAPTTRPARPQSRTMSAPADTMGQRRNRKLRPDSLRRGGATRVDTVRR